MHLINITEPLPGEPGDRSQPGGRRGGGGQRRLLDEVTPEQGSEGQEFPKMHASPCCLGSQRLDLHFSKGFFFF